MRELNGVLSRFNRRSHRRIKQSILLFDRIYCPREPASDLDVAALNDLKFLKERKIIIDSESIVPPLTPIVKFPKKSGPLDATRLMDVVARGLAAEITRRQKGAAVVCPVCELPLPKGFTGLFNGEEPSADAQQVMRVIVEKLPVPGSSSSLEDVLAFKADMRGSKWALQRLLRDLSLKKQTMPEIRASYNYALCCGNCHCNLYAFTLVIARRKREITNNHKDFSDHELKQIRNNDPLIHKYGLRCEPRQ